MPDISKHVAGTPAWFDLMTSDAEAARVFYAGLFGWTFEIGGPESGFYTMCKCGGRNAAGLGQMPPDAPYPPSWTVYFAVEDADATAAAIGAAGGQVMMGPMDVMGEGRMVIAADSTGAVFGLWQPQRHVGASVVHEPGAMTWCEVNTRDPEGAKAFYHKVFGLEARALPGSDGTYHTLHHGELTAAGILRMDARFGEIPPHWMAYFAVADADASCAKAKELGGNVYNGPVDTPYGRMAVIADPQGAVFSIAQPRA